MTQYQSILNAEDEFSVTIERGENAVVIRQEESLIEITNDGSCVHKWIEAQVVQTPDAIAVTVGDEQISYQELNQRANRLAHYLQRNFNVKSETLVGLYLERSLDVIVGLLAILKAGGAYVPLDPAYPRERIALMLEDAQVSVLLTQNCYLAELPTSTAHPVCLDTDWPIIAQVDAANPESLVTPNNLAYVIYTSGSTGKPKGVMIEHCSLSNFVQVASQAYGITASDRVLQFASICFDAAVEEIFLTLTQGATLVLRTPEMLLSTSAFLQACADLKLTVLDLPTAFWHRLCAELSSVELPNTVRLVIIGGERVLPRCLKTWTKHVRPPVRLINTYGPTEATVVATHCDLAGPTIQTQDSVPIGKPFPNIQTHVLDAQMQPVNMGATGELYLSGAGLARGYLNRPDLTQQKFITFNSINGKNSFRFYRTGDMVRYCQDGNLEFLDRIDHQEKIRGFRVELREIEVVLEQHPAVQEAVVIVRQDKPDDKQLVAYVVSNLQNWDRLDASDWDRFEREQINQWRLIHNDDHFNPAATHWDTAFNISGWTSSYTGQIIPDVEMQEWVSHTVTRILTQQPQHVLEIGCGTGLLLFRIAPHCLSYTGTDISEVALNFVRQQLNCLSQSLAVTLEQRVADDLISLERQSVDTVILNSVIQYFPSIDYLVSVLAQAIRLIQPGGCIFIGDVRNYLLLEAFATSVEVFQAADDLPLEKLRQRIQKRLQQEEELTVDPAFFFALQKQIPQISQVQVLQKRGQFQNELTQFRYDVILQIGNVPSPQTPSPQIDSPELDGQQFTLQQLRQLLQETDSPVSIRGILNARTATAMKTVELLKHPDCPQTVGLLRQQAAPINSGIDPEELWQLADDLSYEVRIGEIGSTKAGYYDVVLQPAAFSNAMSCMKPSQAADAFFKPWHTYANNPLFGKLIYTLMVQLRAYLKQRLPDYMLPAAFVILEALPVSPSGKIDRHALPAPSSDRPALEVPFVAPRTTLEQELAKIWSTVLEIDQVGVKDGFFELGGDSLRFMQLVYQIQSAYQTDLSSISFAQSSTIADLAAQLAKIDRNQQALKSNNQKTVNQSCSLIYSGRMNLQQLNAEVILDDAIQPSGVIRPIPASIFLTGATGFVGAFILHELLQQTEAKVYCLIRAQSLAQAQQKLHDALGRYLPEVEFPSARIIPILGDLTQPRLGLAEAPFQQLAAAVDVVYHSAANVNLLFPYAALKAVNVLGTQEILRLASHTRLKPVHYISTLDVFESFASTGVSVISEQDTIAQGNGITGGYAQSKWVAEQLVSQAAARGLPICIYRPGMVTGHQHSGISNPDDLMGRLLRGIIQLRNLPQLDLSIDMTPVDYVSQAIVHLSRQPESYGKAFHLVNAKPMTCSQLIEALRHIGYEIEQVPYEQWQTILKQKSSALTPLAQVLTEPTWHQSLTHLELWLTGQMFDAQNTMTGLQHSGISCPPVNAKLLNKYLAYLIQL